MKFRDKLEQYIKREVDSISYNEGDEMWEEFQKKKVAELDEIHSILYFFPILLSSLVLGFLIFYFFTQPTIEENFDTKQPITQLDSSSFEENYKINIQKSEKPLDELLVELDSKLEEKPTSNNLSINENSKVELKKERTSNSSENLLVKSKNQGFNENQNSEFEANVAKESSFFKTSSEYLSKTNLEALSKNQEVIYLSKSNKKLGTKKFRITNLEPIENPLQQLYIKPQKLDIPFKSYSPFIFDSEKYIRISLSGSYNRIYTSSIELGFLKMTSKRTGFKINLGGSVVDGYSFSQDSVFIRNGLTIESIERNKDLDFVLNSHLSGEFFIRRKAFSFGLGIKNSYAIFNRFKIIQLTNETRFNGGIFGGTLKTSAFNQWQGINRLSVEPFANFSYKHNNYEIGLIASKKLNNLIDGGLAQRRKSNTLIQVGLQFTTYL